ncbi:hypothetical protein MHM93_16165 [Pseudoalteromonas sp. MM17-2]|uniref:hypothetical protein n=1 Tax=unclassified Pseudoalteromonas TaxID=194690 RepID=UPI001022A1B7|nr:MULTISPECIES: hypothetical protein [unclassified Pseudoalteromonas]MCG7545718.1 hypothetical protein [Pseudoalteromonas sp. MM17-2]RZF83012.1 hypothetical protein EXT46_06045 [Pseudoalteromonas sp. CO325X]
MSFKQISNELAVLNKGSKIFVARFIGVFITLIGAANLFSVARGDMPLFVWASVTTLGLIGLFGSYAVWVDKRKQAVTIRAKMLFPIKTKHIKFGDIEAVVVDERMLDRHDARLFLQLTNGDRFNLAPKGFKKRLERDGEDLAKFIDIPLHVTYKQ